MDRSNSDDRMIILSSLIYYSDRTGTDHMDRGFHFIIIVFWFWPTQNLTGRSDGWLGHHVLLDRLPEPWIQRSLQLISSAQCIQLIMFLSIFLCHNLDFCNDKWAIEGYRGWDVLFSTRDVQVSATGASIHAYDAAQGGWPQDPTGIGMGTSIPVVPIPICPSMRFMTGRAIK